MSQASKYTRTNYSFSGCDIVCTIDISLDNNKTAVSTIGALQTITYSIHQDKLPVRRKGQVNPAGYVDGNMTIAGTLIFAVFQKHIIHDILAEAQKKDEHSSLFTMHELPPFNITISFQNEYGIASRMAIYGVRIVNEGQTMSINDIYTENTYQYVATSIEYMSESSHSSNLSKNKLAGEKAHNEYYQYNTIIYNHANIDKANQINVDKTEDGLSIH